MKNMYKWKIKKKLKKSVKYNNKPYMGIKNSGL